MTSERRRPRAAHPGTVKRNDLDAIHYNERNARSSPTMRYLADRDRILGIGGARWLAGRLLRAVGSRAAAVAVVNSVADDEGRAA